MISPTRPSRIKAIPAFLAFVVPGLVLLALGLSAIVPLLKAVGTRAPLVTFSPRDTIALPLAVTFLAFAAMTMMPASAAKSARRARRPDPSVVVLAVAVAGLVLAVVISPIAQVIAARYVAERNYKACPARKVWERHPPLRWARAITECPR